MAWHHPRQNAPLQWSNRPERPASRTTRGIRGTRTATARAVTETFLCTGPSHESACGDAEFHPRWSELIQNTMQKPILDLI